MVLSLKSLNPDATLNNFQDIGTQQVARGSDAVILLQFFQPSKKIRYIPDVAAVITVDLLKSDSTVLTKTATFPFPDDRSIISIALSATETANLVSQNLNVKIVEGSITNYAILQSGLQMLSLNQGC